MYTCGSIFCRKENKNQYKADDKKRMGNTSVRFSVWFMSFEMRKNMLENVVYLCPPQLGPNKMWITKDLDGKWLFLISRLWTKSNRTNQIKSTWVLGACSEHIKRSLCRSKDHFIFKFDRNLREYWFLYHCISSLRFVSFCPLRKWKISAPARLFGENGWAFCTLTKLNTFLDNLWIIHFNTEIESVS